MNPTNHSRVALATISLFAAASVLLLLLAPLSRAQTTMTSPPDIAQPQIPAHHFNIIDYGASPDGKTSSTIAIKKAIAACQAAGGGTIEIPAGKFLTGPFEFISNLDLHLDAGATLLISNDPHDYTPSNHAFQNCIQATDCHDISITGSGTIDGQGDFWWKHYVRPKNARATLDLPRRPFMIVLHHCQRVLVQGINLLNSPNFNLAPDECSDLLIDSIHIDAPASSPNTDGIDISGVNCRITNCTIDNGDDDIVLKPSASPTAANPSCQNIWIDHCTFLHGHGMSIGSVTHGGLREMMIRACTFDGTQAGIRMKSGRGVGGLIENVTYDHIRMKHVKNAVYITSYYPKVPPDAASATTKPVDDRTPMFRNILIHDLISESGDTAGQIVGLPEMPVSNIQLSDVDLSANKSVQITWSNGIHFINSRIRVGSSPAVIITHSQVDGIDPITGNPAAQAATTPDR
jgi:polygalacturonase